MQEHNDRTCYKDEKCVQNQKGRDLSMDGRIMSILNRM